MLVADQKKSGINHIWTLKQIIHDQLSSVKKKPIVFQQYDYKQMFDGMDSNEACGDIFSYGIMTIISTLFRRQIKRLR